MAGTSKKRDGQPVDQLNNRIFFRLFQAANTLQRQSVKVLGFTTVQWAVLGALSRSSVAPGMTVGDLAEYLIVSRQNLDGVLRRLEREGLAERVIDPTDRRARRVRLTATGRDRWTSLLDKISEFYDQAATGLDAVEREALAHGLGSLISNLRSVKVEVADDLRLERNADAP